MSWNNGLERKKFNRKQNKQNEEYRALGMSDEAIRALNDLDNEIYNSDRVYCTHTQPLDISVFYESDCDESDNALLKKFGDRISITLEDSGCFSRYWWIEELDTPELAKAIKELPKEDIELLTLYVFDQMTQQEIAKILGVSQPAVVKRLSKIKEKLSFFKKI